jgi:hypothetical protein
MNVCPFFIKFIKMTKATIVNFFYRSYQVLLTDVVIIPRWAIQGWMILFKKQLFDLEVKGQGPTKVIMVCDTSPYGHAPTFQISLTYLERQKCYGPDKKILLFFLPKLSSFIDWCCYYTQVSYTGSWEPLVSSSASVSFQRSLSGPQLLLSFQIDQLYLVCGCMTIWLNDTI